ncbi:MAG: hypothetical protein AAFV88_10765 [Planctomycetota bacterium]
MDEIQHACSPPFAKPFSIAVNTLSSCMTSRATSRTTTSFAKTETFPGSLTRGTRLWQWFVCVNFTFRVSCFITDVARDDASAVLPDFLEEPFDFVVNHCVQLDGRRWKSNGRPGNLLKHIGKTQNRVKRLAIRLYPLLIDEIG